MNDAWVHGISPDPVNREKDDFYPTPPEGTRALLSVENFDGVIWEPACGDGSISKVLEEEDYLVESSDLVYRGYGVGGLDFLTAVGKADNIVTNPPFKLAEEFARHAIELAEKKVALLCRLAWLESERRRKLFTSTPLARVWVFSKRLQIQRGRLKQPGEASGMIAFAWYVWEHGHTGLPTIGWI